MKARELRIGNFINGIYHDYDDGSQEDIENETLCKVVTLDVSGNGDYPIYVYSDEDIEHFSVFKPIPLTEEWLIEFGFSREVKVGSEMGTDGVEFRVYHFDVLTFNTNHGWWYKVQRINDTPLEYVHQLQNLYFALTGEELTRKP
jgi:hypothetical protein